MLRKILTVLVIVIMLLPICACMVYLYQEEGKVSPPAIKRTLDEVAMDEIFYLDDEAIALADSSETNVVLRSEAIRCFNHVNSYRTANGISEIIWDSNLESAAKIRAEEISRSFSHTRPNGKKWNSVNSKIMHGENLAYGFYDAPRCIEALINSQTHRENILWPDFNRIAIAIYEDDSGTYFWAMEFGY